MHSDGKQLEALVAFVEEKLLPPGFAVVPNARVFNEDGVQIAEFDIEIRGRVGSTDIAWLIECRDRPGHGSAPTSWIEQLVGRRERFRFNKVTAVSTTGFAAGAAEYAERSGIELREVRGLNPSEFSDWLHISEMRQVKKIHDLHHASIVVDASISESLATAAIELLATAKGTDEVLVSSSTKERCTVTQAFMGAVGTQPTIFDTVTVESPRRVQLCVDYVGDDHFYLDTKVGIAKVSRIEFFGELRIEERLVPVTKTVEYRHAGTGRPISQLAAFAPQSIDDMNVAVELHRLAESGETIVTLRRVAD